MKKLDQVGFTLPELVATMAITLLFAGLIMFFGFDFWRTATLQQSDEDTLISRLNVGDYIRENIGESSGLIIQNGLPDSHTLKPDPTYVSHLYWLPLHAIPSHIVIGSPGTYTPVIYFRKFSVNTSKQLIMNGVTPYEDEFVLYLDGSSKELLARTIANPSAPSNHLKTTCPPAQASVSCPADKIVASDIDSVDTRFFSRNGTLLDYSSSTDPNTGSYNGPDFPVVEVLELTIKFKARPLFESSDATQNSTIIRIALRNS